MASNNCIHRNSIDMRHNYFNRLKELSNEKNNSFTDVELIPVDADGAPIQSNKFLLASQSEYFRRLFVGGDHNATNRVRLNHRKDIPIEIFERLHDYVFTAKLKVAQLSERETFHMFELANHYLFGDIIEMMANKIGHSVSAENCWSVLSMAIEFDNNCLIDRCAQFITREIHDEETIKSNLIRLDKNTFVRLLKRDTFYFADELRVVCLVKQFLEFHKELDDKSDVVSVIRLPLLLAKDKKLVLESNLKHLLDLRLLDEKIHYRSLHPIEPLVENSEHFKNDEVVGVDPDGHHIPVQEAIDNNYSIVVVVVIDEIYSINNISFQFREEAEYYYRIEVSADKQEWTTIVDYGRFRCHGKQQIWFRAIPVKYIKMIGTNIVRPRNSIETTQSSSSLVFLNVEDFQVFLDPKPKTMSANIDNLGNSYLIPDTDVAHLAKGQGKQHNNSVNNVLLKEKYFHPYRFDMDRPDPTKHYALHLPQPVLLSTLKFLLYDKKNNTDEIRQYSYRVELSVDNQDWKTVKENSNKQSWQSIEFRETLTQFIRIIPVGIVSYNRRKIFAIVHFEAPNCSPESF